jgi:cell division protein FtsL
MSPRAAAAAVARGAAATVHAPTRTRPARRPAPARRRSGATVRPAPRVAPRFDGVAILDRLLRGPAYIGLVGLLLAGIVFFNVDVLELNHGIARTDTRASQLKRENAALTLKLAKLGSSERIQRLALDQGLVLPQPGDVRYLRANREDAERALRVMTAPDSSSAAPVVPTLVTQQSGGAATATGTPSQGVTPQQTGDTITPAPTTTTPQPTTPTQTTPTTTTQQQTTPTQTATTTPATTTQGGAAAAPATP